MGFWTPGSGEGPMAFGARLGVTIGGGVGMVAGLVVGLCVYPPTAWFAVFEIGVPSAVVGAVVGLVAGSIVAAWRRLRRSG